MDNIDPKPVRVLLIEDNPLDVRLVRTDFSTWAPAEFKLDVAENLNEAVRLLSENRIDVVLLDLFLRDTTGLNTLVRVREAAPDAAVVVLTSLNDEALAIQALKHGAQDYLIKGNVSGAALFRAIRYSAERRQHERDHDLLERRLLQVQKLEAIGILAGGVAHNFNNALMVILGHSNLMIEQAAAGDGKRHLESIVRAASRAANLTRQLLTFSKRHPVEPFVTRLGPVILGMRGLIESVLGSDMQLELNLDAEADFVKVDPNQIQEMIMNLVLNARSAIGNSGRITIETRRSLDSPRRILLSVSDTGCGMSAETRSHIFDPFFTTKGLVEATGLGLSTVHGIVEQHNASIEVSSELGCGTTFTIAFPLCSSAECVPDFRSSANRGSIPRPPQWRNYLGQREVHCGGAHVR